jgi:hypothetical protein
MAFPSRMASLARPLWNERADRFSQKGHESPLLRDSQSSGQVRFISLPAISRTRPSAQFCTAGECRLLVVSSKQRGTRAPSPFVRHDSPGWPDGRQPVSAGSACEMPLSGSPAASRVISPAGFPQTPEARQSRPLHAGSPPAVASADHAIEVIENSRIEIVLPKHGPTDGADSMPE